jgi:hypothetical protein
VPTIPLEVGLMTEDVSSSAQTAGWIVDARDRKVSQLDPVMMHLMRRPGIIPSDVLRDIAQKVGLGVTRATRVSFWASIVGVACLVIAVAICLTRHANGSISTARFFRNLVPYTGVLAGLVGCWISLRSARHQKIGSIMLEQRRCPHCGYDVRLLPTDPGDGATVCPECGCAWRLEPDAK